MNTTFAIENRIARITLARPERFNCISSTLLSEMSEHLTAAEDHAEVRALLILAEGPHFCTGADLDEVQQLRENATRLRAFLAKGHRFLDQLTASSLPVVAGVQGLCLAGGLELSLATDVVIAAHDAQFGCQHANYRLIPGWDGSRRLPRTVGLRPSKSGVRPGGEGCSVSSRAFRIRAPGALSGRGEPGSLSEGSSAW